MFTYNKDQALEATLRNKQRIAEESIQDTLRELNDQILGRVYAGQTTTFFTSCDYTHQEIIIKALKALGYRVTKSHSMATMLEISWD